MPTSKGTLSSEIAQHKNLKLVLICLALVILTMISFWSLKDCGFINLDDDMYVYANTHVQSGLNANSIKQAFSSELAKVGHWHPLTWLSLMLDYQIFGLNPSGYHLINLLFHVLNTLLLFLFLRRMTKSLWPSAFVAALFAIHPLHVESVAWITERKDVLSTFFWMLTLGAYSYYVEHRNLKRYAFVLLFFTLGLLSKPMLVTLPFVLLLLDYWPLNRISEIKPAQKVQPQVLKSQVADSFKKKNRKKQAAGAKQPLPVQKPTVPKYKWSLIYPLLWEKVPLFILAILSSIATYFAARSVGAVSSMEEIPVGVRIGNAFVSYIAYIGKMIWPINLAVFYPYPKLLVTWQVMGAVILLIAITAAVIWKFKKLPYLAAGWFWYLITLVPVIGIVQAGAQAMADRYTYISLIGLFIMVAWGVPDLLGKWNDRKEILWALSALIILCLSIKTGTQVGYWQSSITLFDHTLKVTDHNWFIYNNRGFVHNSLGNYSQAIEDCSRAIAIKPDHAEAYNNRCNAYNYIGNHKLAFEDCNRAIKIKPGYAEAYNNRGVTHSGLGNYSQAIEDYNRVIELKPGYAETYINRGIAHNGLRNYSQAIKDCGRALEIQPKYAEAYFNRGNAYNGLGNYSQAIADYGRAIEIKPDFTAAYKNRGIAYARFGNNNLAIQDLKTAAKLGDENAKAFLSSRGINW